MHAKHWVHSASPAHASYSLQHVSLAHAVHGSSPPSGGQTAIPELVEDAVVLDDDAVDEDDDVPVALLLLTTEDDVVAPPPLAPVSSPQPM